LFDRRPFGFYVDVGAHHPFRYSNTQLLYQKGWSGINIDPNFGFKKIFDKVRQRDINLEVAVDNSANEMRLYIFEDSAFNTLKKNRADAVLKSKQSKLRKIKKVNTKRLGDLIKKYSQQNNIDLLNIDVEGNELSVLKSLDWRHQKPDVILVETLQRKEIIDNFLRKRKYLIAAKTLSTLIFKKI
jgi:FkbM family methyltransferase